MNSSQRRECSPVLLTLQGKRESKDCGGCASYFICFIKFNRIFVFLMGSGTGYPKLSVILILRPI